MRNALKIVGQILLLTAIIALGACAQSQFQAGADEYKRGNYAGAVKALLPLAERGHVKSQFIIGSLYLIGKGVPEDHVEAARWLGKAAEQGDVVAQFYLGHMYHEGQGVPKNDTEAAKWFRKAAEQGHAPSQHNLGVMYNKGEGVAQNLVEAVKWFRKAAEQGDVESQLNLGLSYLSGRGVVQDDTVAYALVQIAAAQGSHSAITMKWLMEADMTTARLTPDEIAEAERIARECSEREYKGCEF